LGAATVTARGAARWFARSQAAGIPASAADGPGWRSCAAASARSISTIKLPDQLRSTAYSIRNASALGAASREGRIRRSSAASGGDTARSSSRRIARDWRCSLGIPSGGSAAQSSCSQVASSSDHARSSRSGSSIRSAEPAPAGLPTITTNRRAGAATSWPACRPLAVSGSFMQPGCWPAAAAGQGRSSRIDVARSRAAGP
jgi:hypothetical protein